MINPKNHFNKYYHFLKNQNLHFIILVILVVFDTVMITEFLDNSQNQELSFYFYVPAKVKGISSDSFRLLDGVVVEPGQATSSRPLAVLIENHFESWPPTGLAQANLVYEFLTEGGITRFLAFYDPENKVKKIGPIRSCRPYFLEVTEEFQALFAHVGGSSACLDSLKNRQYDVYDLDEYAKTDYFWRSQTRLPPHNVYTSTELLTKYLNDKDIDIDHPFESWQFKNDSPVTTTTAEIVNVDFSIYTYNVEWQYNEESNDYTRYVTNEPHQDSSGAIIKAKNIIVQYVKARVLDSIGRLSLKMESRGDAVVFQDGQVIQGYWKKPDRSSRTRFYSNDGEEIAFNRGLTWVEVLPTDREVSWE